MASLVTPELIELSAPGSPRVSAWRLGALAVHQTLGDPAKWTITHLPSGLHFGFFWTSRLRAIAAMQKIAELTPDWPSLRPFEIEQHGASVYRVCLETKGQRFTFIPRVASPKGKFNGY